MAIPEFGIQRENEERRDGGCAVVFDPETKLFAVGSHDNRKAYSLFSGGVEKGEEIQAGILREVNEESGLHDFLSVENLGEVITHYYNNRKDVNRVAHATGLLVVLKSRSLIPTKLEPHERFELIWRDAADILGNWRACNQNEDYSHYIYFFEKALARLRELRYLD